MVGRSALQHVDMALQVHNGPIIHTCSRTFMSCLHERKAFLTSLSSSFDICWQDPRRTRRCEKRIAYYGDACTCLPPPFCLRLRRVRCEYLFQKMSTGASRTRSVA